MKAPLAEDTPSMSGSGGVDNCSDLEDLAIPSHLKKPMWDKANKLASDDSAIVKAPGDEDGWMVMCSSGTRPHYVKMSKCAFACDDQCLSYKSMKCAHIPLHLRLKPTVSVISSSGIALESLLLISQLCLKQANPNQPARSLQEKVFRRNARGRSAQL